MTRIARRTFIKHAAAAGAALSGGVPGLAFAQEVYPNRTVNFIVPLAPGGGIDFVARTVGEYSRARSASRWWWRTAPARAARVGMDTAMKSPPDGYTVLITNDNAASAPHIMRLALRLHQGADAGDLPGPAAAGSRGASVAERQFGRRADHLREGQSGGLGYATSGVGSNQHIIGEWFKQETGLKLDHVPVQAAPARRSTIWSPAT